MGPSLLRTPHPAPPVPTTHIHHYHPHTFIYSNMAIPVDLFLLVLRSASAHDRLHAGELMLAVVRNLPVSS